MPEPSSKDARDAPTCCVRAAEQAMARYVGCYLEIPSPWQQANPADRLVPYRLFDAPDPDLTIEKCANLARAGGFQYFSLSWGNREFRCLAHSLHLACWLMCESTPCYADTPCHLATCHNTLLHNTAPHHTSTTSHSTLSHSTTQHDTPKRPSPQTLLHTTARNTR
eukprot:119605-Chlamydomonas_euryale.AAC.6